MDSLTHIVLGAAIGEALLGKRLGRKAMLWGALADTIPDFDMFARPFCSSAEHLMVHRGITHSFLFVGIMSLLLGWLFNKWQKREDVGFKGWTWLFFLGMFTHVLLDSLTSYGTGWFEPFSSYRVSFNTIFVADPFYTIPFLICVLVALIAKNGTQKRVKWNKAGLWISTLYLIFTIINHIYVDHVMEASFHEKNLTADRFTVTPTALNNFLWMGYSHDSAGTYIGYYSIFDKDKNIEYRRFERRDSLLKPFEKDAQVQILKQFSKGDYVMTTHDSSVYFNDIRFGQKGGWDNSDPQFVFGFKLNNKANNSMALDRMKFKTSIGEVFRSLIKRIGGK